MNEVIVKEDKKDLNDITLNIVNKYLENHSIEQTALELNISPYSVDEAINKPMAKRYIDSVFAEFGYVNRFKIASTMNKIIEDKLQELEESEMTSTKDIADLLKMMHDMGKDHAKLNQTGPSKQQNVQINNYGENYNALTKALIDG